MSAWRSGSISTSLGARSDERLRRRLAPTTSSSWALSQERGRLVCHSALSPPRTNRSAALPPAWQTAPASPVDFPPTRTHGPQPVPLYDLRHRAPLPGANTSMFPDAHDEASGAALSTPPSDSQGSQLVPF